MLLDCRPVIDNLLLLRSQIPERDVSPYAHLAADISHERPHQGVPGGDRSSVDGQRLVRHQSRLVNLPHDAGAAAAPAGSAAVEGEILGGRRPEFRAALRADRLDALGAGK